MYGHTIWTSVEIAAHPVMRPCFHRPATGLSAQPYKLAVQRVKYKPRILSCFSEFCSAKVIRLSRAWWFVSDLLNYVSGVSSSPQENSHHASSSHPHPNRTSEMVSWLVSGLSEELACLKEACAIRYSQHFVVCYSPITTVRISNVE